MSFSFHVHVRGRTQDLGFCRSGILWDLVASFPDTLLAFVHCVHDKSWGVELGYRTWPISIVVTHSTCYYHHFNARLCNQLRSKMSLNQLSYSWVFMHVQYEFSSSTHSECLLYTAVLYIAGITQAWNLHLSCKALYHHSWLSSDGIPGGGWNIPGNSHSHTHQTRKTIFLCE